MSTKINRHVFHGVYSNFGYRPEFSHRKKLANYPIHFFRAISANAEEGSDFPKEYQTEEEILKAYKKNKYGDTEYNKLKFPDHICKNYFIISETDFYKYRNLFHRMIKGVKINSEIEIKSEGTAFSPQCPECKKDFKLGSEAGDTAGPITFNSPDGRPTYFEVSGGADDIGYLNGVQITNGDTAGPFNPELITSEPQSTLSFTAKDTVGVNVGIEATVTWYKKIEYKQQVNFKINFDSTKIFDFSELQKRLGAHIVDYSTSIDFKEDKNKEELKSERDKKVFKNEWQFDQSEFKSIFEAPKFNFNTTFINDPVILPKDTAPAYSTGPSINSKQISAINKHIFSKGGDTLNSESVNKQKNFEKEFTKFGSVKYKFNNENTIVENTDQYSNLYISDLFYIKNKKIYLCFVEFHNEIPLTGSVIDKDKECGDLECEENSSSSSSSAAPSSSNNYLLENKLFISIIDLLDDKDIIKILSTDNYSKVEKTNPLNIKYVFTTRDTVNIDPPKYKTSECSTEEKKLEFDKTKCKIKIADQQFEIEVFKLKEKEFIYDNSTCTDLKPGYKKLIKNTFSVNLINGPSIELLDWKDSDFDKNNIFPPKIV